MNDVDISYTSGNNMTLDLMCKFFKLLATVSFQRLEFERIVATWAEVC